MRDKDFPTDKNELANYITANLARDLNISPDAAWGIVQRLSHESGLVAGRQETAASRASVGNAGLGGKGWGQWTGPRRQDFINATKDSGGVMSPTANYQYLLADITQNHPDLVTALRDPNINTQKANQIFTQGYEMGRGPFAAKQFKPVQIGGMTVPVQEAASKSDPYDTLFDDHQTLPAAPAPAATPPAPAPPPAPTPATNAPAPKSDPYDNLFATPTNAEPTPAVASPAPAVASPENPTEGRGVAAAVPQGSAGNDVRVGAGQGLGFLSRAALDPVGTLIMQPAVSLGTLAYNHLAPLVGGHALAPETVQRLVTEAGNYGPFQRTPPTDEIGRAHV